MRNAESTLKDETHKLLWDFEIQMDHLILARWPDPVIVKKKKKRTCWIMDYAVPADHRVKLKESEKRDKYLDLASELNKTMENENDGDTDCNWRARYSHQKIDTETGGLGNKRTSCDHQNYSIVEIDQNSKNNQGDLRRLAVTQISDEKHRLTLVWKTLTWAR